MSELEQRLSAAATTYPFPATPDLAGGARSRLAERVPRSRRPLVLAIALGAIAVAAGVLALSPGARSAVVDLLERVPGISIERAPELPEATYVEEPRYGEPVTLAEARRHFGAPLRLPDGVGDPDRLYWLGYPPGDTITAVYGDEREARLVVSQWKVGVDDLFHKTLLGRTGIQSVSVDGARGVWIYGADHGVWYLVPGARDRPGARHYLAEAYLAGNVLAWQRRGIAYRIEADVPLADALELARSLEAVE